MGGGGEGGEVRDTMIHVGGYDVYNGECSCEGISWVHWGMFSSNKWILSMTPHT